MKINNRFKNKNIGLTKRRNMKIGVLGGSFNPAHEGHIHISNIYLPIYLSICIYPSIFLSIRIAIFLSTSIYKQIYLSIRYEYFRWRVPWAEQVEGSFQIIFALFLSRNLPPPPTISHHPPTKAKMIPKMKRHLKSQNSGYQVKEGQ